MHDPQFGSYKPFPNFFQSMSCCDLGMIPVKINGNIFLEGEIWIPETFHKKMIDEPLKIILAFLNLQGLYFRYLNFDPVF